MNILRMACGIAAGLALWPALARPQPPALSEAVDAAWQRAVASTEADNRLHTAKAERQVANAAWAAPPSVEIAALDDRLLSGLGRRELTLGVAVPVWLPGQREAFRDAAAASDDEARALSAAARHQVAVEVVTAAWALRSTRTTRDLAEARQIAARTLFDDVARRLRAGDLAPVDSLAAEAEVLAAGAEIAVADLQLQAARLRWTLLTGLTDPPETTARATTLRPAETPAAPPAPVHTASATAGDAPIDLSSHPANVAASKRVTLARKRLDAVRASPRATPELVARIRGEQVQGGAANNRALGLAIRVPLDTVDRNAPLLAAAGNDLMLAEHEAWQLGRRLAGAADLARTAVTTAELRHDQERERARLLGERAHLMRKAFQAGEIGLPELLRTLATAREAEADARREADVLGLARNHLDLALGWTP